MLSEGLARDWRDALAMPADLALALLDARAWYAGGGDGAGEAAGDGLRWRHNPDGSSSASFSSMGAIRDFLRAGGEVPGVRMGR